VFQRSTRTCSSRRATADEFLLGTTGWHLDRIADLLIDD